MQKVTKLTNLILTKIRPGLFELLLFDKFCYRFLKTLVILRKQTSSKPIIFGFFIRFY